jgi:hypothetical protein
MPDDNARMRRQRAELAINLAKESKWEDAVATNRGILEVFPNDVEAYNRLGKALVELGRYGEAREAYTRAVEVDPNNTIARKNIARLANLKDVEAVVPAVADKIDPNLFIEEMGKTGHSELVDLAPKEVVARMSAGDHAVLEVVDSSLVVKNLRGEYLGKVEPKLALRLLNFMEGGNRYQAGLTSVHDSNVQVIIKEVFQSEQNRGRMSFPQRVTERFRGYTKDSLYREDIDELEYSEDGEYATDWGAEDSEVGPEERPFLEEGGAEDTESDFDEE